VTAHSRIDQRSLEAHVLMASRVEEEPSLRATALATLDRWMARTSASTPYLEKWRCLLLGDVAELLKVMRSDSDEAAALRQCTPFGGSRFLSHAERFQLIRKYATR
jgi:hypothetical protein